MKKEKKRREKEKRGFLKKCHHSRGLRPRWGTVTTAHVREAVKEKDMVKK